MAKVALVTGGSRGIGAAISTALKDAGYTVAANYAGNDDAARAIALYCDLASRAALDGMSAQMGAAGVDLGALTEAPVEDLEVDETVVAESDA